MIGKTIDFLIPKRNSELRSPQFDEYTGIVLDKIKRKGSHYYLVQYINKDGIRIVGILNPETIKLVYES